ncbi:MAG TPA: peptide chain release factor N(5)-glutamine methyltransferase [Anaerolineae bacterium]|nr:peptide chain release factor N(5)-glutamine methyltransferase [Anaerolineae bacterium]
MTALNAADRTVTVRQALSAAAQQLEAAHVDAPHLAAETLLAHALDFSRTQVLARLEQPMAANQLTHYQTLVDRCESGEPLAYVLGHREFYGLDFQVDPRVLIPRPETELLIETALAIVKAQAGQTACTIADIGTGSGAIAITLALHLPQARLIATDISPEALDVAAENARRHGVAQRIEFKVGDLLTPLQAPVQLITANLPYVRSKEWAHLAHTIREHEPALAFNGGADGLQLVSQLLGEAPRCIQPGGSILLEIGAAQGDAAHELARDFFPTAAIEVKADYAGLDRLLIISTQTSAAA